MFVENPIPGATYYALITDGTDTITIRECAYDGLCEGYLTFKDTETGERHYLPESEGLVYDTYEKAVSGAHFLFDALEEVR